jgi:manganese-dependent inorganic pyrophosphatase
MRPVLVFGHRNPDSDSICAAVAYAHLKNRLVSGQVYVPVRLGDLPAETRWLFDRFGVAVPECVEHVRLRVRDAMTSDVLTVHPDDTLLAVGRLMRDKDIRAVPVTDDGHVVGVMSMEMLAERYLDDIEVAGFSALPVPVRQLARVLEGELLAGDPEAVLSGGVLIGAMEPRTMAKRIKAGDTLLVGDRPRAQQVGIESGIACLVVTGGFAPGPDVLAKAAECNAAVICTEADSYAAARLINLGHQVREVMRESVTSVDADALLSDAAEDVVDSPHRSAVVIDHEGKLVGILTRTSLARAGKREVVLVDHNESAQSAEGIEDASVIEVVDHHRIGDIETAGPVSFVALPVGSTCTIVATRYFEAGIQPPLPMAALMLGALLSDTVLLKSPTATDLDRDVAERLADIVGVEPMEFGMELVRARTVGEAFAPEKVVAADLKEFRVGDATVGIAQYETPDMETVLAHRDDLLAALDALRERRGYDLALLMVTDIVREGTELLASGRTQIAERAFAATFTDGSVWLPGVLSRKKQVAARLLG